MIKKGDPAREWLFVSLKPKATKKLLRQPTQITSSSKSYTHYILGHNEINLIAQKSWGNPKYDGEWKRMQI